MRSSVTAEFRDLLHALPAPIQAKAERLYAIWRENPRHPGLHFKCVDPVERIYSVRVGLDYRALGTLEDDFIIWFWIGHHSEYDSLLR